MGIYVGTSSERKLRLKNFWNRCEYFRDTGMFFTADTGP